MEGFLIRYNMKYKAIDTTHLSADGVVEVMIESLRPLLKADARSGDRDMPDILNPLNFFWKLGYRKVSQDLYGKNYPSPYTVKIDLTKEIIDYGNKIRLYDVAIARFSQRNYVIAECVDRLLMKGYLPSSLHVGYADGCDIAIKDEVGSLIGIRCRRWDDDAYDNEVKAIKNLNGRPITIANEKEQFRFLCVYASTLKSGLIDYGYTIFQLSTGNCVKPDQVLRGEAVSSTTGLFEDEIKPYHPIIAKRTDVDKAVLSVKATLGSIANLKLKTNS